MSLAATSSATLPRCSSPVVIKSSTASQQFDGRKTDGSETPLHEMPLLLKTLVHVCLLGLALSIVMMLVLLGCSLINITHCMLLFLYGVSTLSIACAIAFSTKPSPKRKLHKGPVSSFASRRSLSRSSQSSSLRAIPCQPSQVLPSSHASPAVSADEPTAQPRYEKISKRKLLQTQTMPSMRLTRRNSVTSDHALPAEAKNLCLFDENVVDCRSIRLLLQFSTLFRTSERIAIEGVLLVAAGHLMLFGFQLYEVAGLVQGLFLGVYNYFIFQQTLTTQKSISKTKLFWPIMFTVNILFLLYVAFGVSGIIHGTLLVVGGVMVAVKTGLLELSTSMLILVLLLDALMLVAWHLGAMGLTQFLFIILYSLAYAIENPILRISTFCVAVCNVAVILERLCGPVGYFHTGVVTTVLLALRFLRSPILAFGVAYIDVAIILTSYLGVLQTVLVMSWVAYAAKAAYLDNLKNNAEEEDYGLEEAFSTN